MKTALYEAEPHSMSLNTPTHTMKVSMAKRSPVPMPASHGARKSAAGRDKHRSSNVPPKIPGKMEPSGVQKAMKGPAKFPDQGMKVV
jgi:hypothetical protein